MKPAGEEQEMRGSDLAEAMASAVDRLVNAREGSSALDRAIEAVIGTIGRFSGKDGTMYLASYGAEMLMRDIPKERRLAGFPRVAMLSIHAEVLKVFFDFFFLLLASFFLVFIFFDFFLF